MSIESNSFFNEQLSDNLNCCICAQIMSRHIVICKNGHSACEVCIKLSKICPRCRVTMIDCIRNHDLEGLINKMINIKLLEDDYIEFKMPVRFLNFGEMYKYVKNITYITIDCIDELLRDFISRF